MCVHTMLSGDESIRDGAAMREFLKKHKDWSWTTKSRQGKKKRPQHEAYNMRIIFGVWCTTRIESLEPMRIGSTPVRHMST